MKKKRLAHTIRERKKNLQILISQMVGTKENFVRNPNPELLTDQLNNIWVSFAIDKKHVRTPTVASAPTDPSHMT